MMLDNHLTDGKAALLAYIRELHPQMEIAPCDLQPGGRFALPPGFECHIDDAHDERIRLFGPEDRGTFVPTRRPWGGDFRITCMDLLRGIAELCRVGEPRWSRSLDERADHFRGLVAGVAPFAVPESKPMTRSEMEHFIDSNPACARAVPSFVEASNYTGRVVSDSDLRDFITRATADPESAIKHYEDLAAGRRGIAIVTSAKPPRTRRPVAATQEV